LFTKSICPLYGIELAEVIDRDKDALVNVSVMRLGWHGEEASL